MPNPVVFLSEQQIADRVAVLGRQISDDFRGEEIIVLCVLKGAFIFCSDLVKKIDLPLRIEFISLSSYGDETTSSGEVICDRDCQLDIRDRNVLIVEDIIDTGLTITHLLQMLRSRRPKSISIASLLTREEQGKFVIPINYLGFKIADQFVIGYGLDYAQKYRELPYIGVLNSSDEDS